MTKKRQARVDARALVARLNQEQKHLLQREIIAPWLPGGRIRTRLGGMIYEFRVKETFTGWGCFRPLNERDTEFLREAFPWERGGYLELLPALRVVLLWPGQEKSRPGTWWAIPYNESDAYQRFKLAARPVLVHLCDTTDGAKRFERVIARVDGSTLWFDGPDLLADVTHAEWLRDTSANLEIFERFLPGLAASERRALLLWQLHQLELALTTPSTTEMVRQQHEEALHHDRQQQTAWLRRQVTQVHLEQQLRYALTKADAVLHSYHELFNTDGTPSGLVVEWSEQGHHYRYHSTIAPTLDVVSSGICLSGRDHDFDLTSLVSVMSNASDELG